MAATLTRVRPAKKHEGISSLVVCCVRVDNSALELLSSVDFAAYGLGTVIAATAYDRTAAINLGVTIAVKTVVTSALHGAGNDVTITAIGLIADVSLL